MSADSAAENQPLTCQEPSALRETRVTAALLDLADTLSDDFDPDDFPYRVVDHCLDLLDISDAGVMLAASDGPLRLIASTSERVRLVELFELDAQEGPCHTAYQQAATVEHPHTVGPSHWPDFTTRAHGAGYRSVHATPIRLRTRTIGVLNLFRHESGPLTTADRHLARALADATAISLLQQAALDHHRTLSAQLQHALDSRNVIEQAKGYLASHLSTDPDTAFTRLRTHARHHHFRLSDLSRRIIDGTAYLPPSGTDST
ncbi:GAF and ANTAR domain-containing protein [Streptomyces sp. CRN 30]|uniref:GAF and ANTAR domain-containing protein n=1 Tax=Streptomyces sp. CRN 30 TaxID=3075613 RepID=UPI002A81DE10|nr:GAF and ANTAR domain-containing protein [Streptomyces sp. CRN 30]